MPGPIVPILHATGLEDLSPLNAQIGGLLVTKGLLDNVLSDYLWAAAVLLTSPSVATVGMSLTVPLAIVSDAAFADTGWLVDPSKPTPLSITAAVAVVGGFVAITAAGDTDGSGGAGSGGGLCGLSGIRAPLLGGSRRSQTMSSSSEPAAPTEAEGPDRA